MFNSHASTSQVRAGNAAGILAILLWSGTVGLFRSIGEALGPVGGPAIIFTISGVMVTLFAGLPDVRSMDRRYLLVSGALFVAYEISLALSIGYAHDRGQAMEVGMINYLWPSLTMLFAVLLRQQSATFLLLTPGILLAFAGIVAVMKGNDDASVARIAANFADNPLAYALAFLAAFLWAAYSVLARRYGKGKSAVGLFLLATAAMLWLRFALSEQPPVHFTAQATLEAIVLGLSTATAYSAWNLGVQRGNIGLLAALSYFTPVLSSCLASLWLGVTPPWTFWLGVAMVTAGSLLSWAATRVCRPRAGRGPSR